MTQYKLIALDVDGTLLTDDHQLTPATKDALNRVRQLGAHIVLCTGRSPSITMPIMEELGLEGLMITHNGAATVDVSDNRVLHRYSFALEEVRPVLDYCRREGIHFDLNTEFHLYVEELSEEALETYRKYGLEPTRVDDIAAVGNTFLKSTLAAPPEKLDQLERDWPTLGCSLNMLRSDAVFIDLMHPDANKGNALKQLADILGIRREEVLAIGNYFNDIDMIRFAGTGIAMGNSPEEVRRAADDVTLSNSEDGVAVALYKYVLA